MSNPHPPVSELGVPVKAVTQGTLFAGLDAHGVACLYAVMGQETAVAHGFFLLQIDPVSGACRRFDGPEFAKGVRPCLWSARWRRLFFAASGHEGTDGGLLQFDPRTGQIETLGRLHFDAPLFPVGIAEGADGTIYVSSYPTCALTAYYPASGEFRQFGRLDETDQYLYVRCGADGVVAALVKMTHPHVVVLDPASGKHYAVGPVADTNTQTGHVDLVVGEDGLLYLDSHEGYFRVHSREATPVPSLPAPLPPPALPDGTTFRFLDGAAEHRMQYRTVELRRADGQRRALTLDYAADGTEIYLTRRGPQGKLYGSSVLPLHFFSYDPATAQMTDHGAGVTASGEVYSMDTLGDKLYFCSYTHAILSEYDPAQPYSFGAAIDPAHPERMRLGEFDPAWPCRFRFSDHDNPRQLGRMDTVAYRPRDMVCGPAGKVWVASVPDYGMWGGTLSWYDPATGAFGGAHRNIIPDCSPYALTYLPERDLLAVGFSIYGGSGTTPRAARAGFALWDPHSDAAVWRGDLGLDIVGVMDLEYAGNGLLYAIIHPNPPEVLIARLLLLDLPNERVVCETRLDAVAGWPLEVSFQRDARYLYGATRRAIYRAPLGSVAIDVRWHDDTDGPTAPGALLDGQYYFATHHRLRRIAVGEDVPRRKG